MRISLFIPAFLILAALSLSSCNHSSSPDGGELAKQYCSSCHMFPEPDLADKSTWVNRILPAMGPRLGIFSFQGKAYPNQKNNHLLPKFFYPSQPELTAAQWTAILNYYNTLAPGQPIPQSRKFPIREGLDLFEVKTPEINLGHPPITSCVTMDPRDHYLYICDAMDNHLRVFDSSLHFKSMLQTPSAVTWIDLEDSLKQKGSRTGVLTDIGILNPSEDLKGEVQRIGILENGTVQAVDTPLVTRLHRPVQVLEADLNNDGRKDLLVCDFGNLTGELFWLENLGNGRYAKHMLRDQPGAIKAYIREGRRKGYPDIWVLFAQGDESIYLFENQGNGQFISKRLLQFPPIYGSSYFELDDFNKDGYPDILYTCGDNADFSPILKAYHGVYIFMNDGHNHFTQKFFFPIDGCYKAMARDFRNNGKLDIAAIAFFADYKDQPQESFVYLENEGNLDFRPYTLPIYQLGRWISMDVGDLYGNGRQDIVLGNFSMGPTNIPTPFNWRYDPPFLVLKNLGAEIPVK